MQVDDTQMQGQLLDKVGTLREHSRGELAAGLALATHGGVPVTVVFVFPVNPNRPAEVRMFAGLVPSLSSSAGDLLRPIPGAA